MHSRNSSPSALASPVALLPPGGLAIAIPARLVVSWWLHCPPHCPGSLSSVQLDSSRFAAVKVSTERTSAEQTHHSTLRRLCSEVRVAENESYIRHDRLVVVMRPTAPRQASLHLVHQLRLYGPLLLPLLPLRLPPLPLCSRLHLPHPPRTTRLGTLPLYVCFSSLESQMSHLLTLSMHFLS